VMEKNGQEVSVDGCSRSRLEVPFLQCNVKYVLGCDDRVRVAFVKKKEVYLHFQFQFQYLSAEAKKIKLEGELSFSFIIT
jgi:hypothetical protein